MPTYKQLPHNKKRDLEFSFEEPVDRFFSILWGSKKILAPYLAVLIAFLTGFVLFQAYRGYYNDRAVELLAKDQWIKVTTEYPRSPSAFLARIKLGTQALQNQKYDEATEWYTSVSQDAKSPAIFRIEALHNLAFIYVKKGEFPKAIRLLEQVLKDPKNVTADYSRLILAKVYEMNDQKENAREIYKSLSEGSATASLREEAKARLTPQEGKSK